VSVYVVAFALVARPGGWDQALLQACPHYPNMRVFDWAHFARPDWFISDGIHYTSPGYVARSRLIAQALAAAFPQVQPPPHELRAGWGAPAGLGAGCLVY
jgi:lysophospholipase L1-like esterase